MAHYYVYAGVRSKPSFDPWYSILAYLYTEADDPNQAIANWVIYFSPAEKDKLDMNTLTVVDIAAECPSLEEYFINNRGKFFDGTATGREESPVHEVIK